LLRVSEIVPGKQRTFEEVKDEIRDRLADERAGQELQTLHESVENERSAGKTLKEIADKLGLTYSEIGETDRTGKTGEGKPALEHSQSAQIIQAVFAGAVGLEAEAADLAEGGYAWVDVVAVTPEKQKPFEAVKEEVKTATIEAERRKEIAAFASKLVERIAKGESMEALAKETGGKLELTQPVTRTTSPPGLPQNAVQQAFALPQGGATSALTSDGKARVIVRVASITPAPTPTPEQTANLKSELTRQFQSDVLAEYVAGLQTRYGLSVNDAALKQALGTGGRDQSDLE
jgi:peptidyl-prolyl cis-trans isomerase D